MFGTPYLGYYISVYSITCSKPLNKPTLFCSHMCFYVSIICQVVEFLERLLNPELHFLPLSPIYPTWLPNQSIHRSCPPLSRTQHTPGFQPTLVTAPHVDQGNRLFLGF